MRTQNTIDDDVRLAQEGFAEFVERTGIKPMHKSRWIAGYSAIFLIAVVSVVGVFFYRAQSVDNGWMRVSTYFAQTQMVDLPDGSRVKLGPCSQIIYPRTFSGSTREVLLVGEAFFDVAKDTKRKFMVNAGNMEIVVHGTQFNVSSYLSDEEDEVALVEGSVEMRLQGDSTSIFLRPGEMVKFDKVNNVTERRSFAANCFREAIASDGLQFNNEKLGDIVATLNRRFNANIIIENEKVSSSRYFASFINGEGAEQILSALNLNGDFRISKKGNTFFIN